MGSIANELAEKIKSLLETLSYDQVMGKHHAG